MSATATSVRRAFSLIEVLVAIVLLAIGLVALQGALTLAVRAMATADRESRAATLASLERERVFASCLTGSGQDTVNGVTSTWTSVPAGRNVRISQVTRFMTRAGPRVQAYDAIGGCP